MIRSMKSMKMSVLPVALFVVVALAACGSGEEESVFGPPALPGPDAAAPAAIQIREVPVEVVREVIVEKEVIRDVSAAFAPLPTPAPAAVAPGLAPRPPVAEGVFTQQEDLVLVTQERIIVRTVEMGLVVRGVSTALDTIADMAEELNGWVVNSDRSAIHRGSISIRVPADSLDQAVRGGCGRWRSRSSPSY